MRRPGFHVLTLMLALSVLAGCGAAAASPTPTPNPTFTPVLPTATSTPGQPQVASLTAGATQLGSFVLKLNASRTGITEVDFNFASFSCGSASVNGGISVTTTTPWPITNGQFMLSMDLSGGGLGTFTITGAFDGTGTHASGTWASTAGCSGTWQA